MSHTRAVLKQNFRLLVAFRRTVWLNRWERQTSWCAVSQFLLGAAVKRVARSDEINHLRNNKHYEYVSVFLP
jgi:hypothetical protein